MPYIYHVVNFIDCISIYFQYIEVFHHRSVGIPHYINPEVLQGQYNKKSDLWNPAVILYAILSGSFPFDGDTNKDIYKAITKKI